MQGELWDGNDFAGWFRHTIDPVEKRGETSEQMRFCVGLDGSSVSFRALEIALSLIKPERDLLIVVHVADEQRRLSEALGNEVEARTRDASTQFQEIQKAPAQSTAQALCSYAIKRECHYIVVGAYGRKGEHILRRGHIADATLRTMPPSCAVVVVKGGSPVPALRNEKERSLNDTRRVQLDEQGYEVQSEPYKTEPSFRKTERALWLFCSDFSIAANAGFGRSIARLLKTAEPFERDRFQSELHGPALGDRVIVLHITEYAAFADTIADFHETRLHNAGITGQVLRLQLVVRRSQDSALAASRCLKSSLSTSSSSDLMAMPRAFSRPGLARPHDASASWPSARS